MNYPALKDRDFPPIELKLKLVNGLLKEAKGKFGKTGFHGVWFDEKAKEVALSVIVKNDVRILRFSIPEK